MNIALIGYGKTGREVEAAAKERGHHISAIYTGKSPLSDATYQQTDCFIDFSSASVVEHNVEIAAQHNAPIIVGTTGWVEQHERIMDIVHQHNGTLLYGNNFSIGAQIFFSIIAHAASLMNAFSQYDVAIHEIHHTMKKDSPSGTALQLGKHILNNIDRKKTIRTSVDASLISNEELMISSSRVGNVCGVHSVLFTSQFDEIECIHTAHNRKGFALGAVIAAEWVINKKGVYTMEDVINDMLFKK